MENRNNFVLRKLRYALNLRDRDVVKIFALDNYSTDEATVKQFMEAEDSPLFRKLSDSVLESFLNGLITYRRGKKEDTNYAQERKPKRVLMPEKKTN